MSMDKYLYLFPEETRFSHCIMARFHAFRLLPGQDLKNEIEAFVRKEQIRAGWVASGVGSLTDYHIRFANCKDGEHGKGYFEILSLSGTVSVSGVHLHLSIGDQKGHVTGGHLLTGNLVYTTCEIILAEIENLEFTREKDGTTSWPELQIKSR